MRLLPSSGPVAISGVRFSVGILVTSSENRIVLPNGPDSVYETSSNMR